ncbi:TonB-dependent receptor domain-containing protein [Sphingomonas aerophila]|uniref:Iron complex outermembrane receptor protein n=1 Tax=Sphingomonas aerophila TaxID=1344948 RepID=A0A7W9B9Y7_9SPHN|nr:iron complex outermembrane receptor protein [Sphingomonas aerophila]
MITTFSSARKAALLTATTPFALALATVPALAQNSTTEPAQTQATQPTQDSLPGAQQNAENQADAGRQLPAPTAETQDNGGDVVVTGSLLRTQGATPSPVTTLTSENLDQRGINTTQDAIQRLSSNNGAALTNSFTANGAFAGGASAVSLRGLSSSSTLVLFDGLRAAYYPLADDATRNFVDLNTIPDDIVDRIEVLRDGASSSYGADAIAGVVNIITKRSFNGISGRAEAGIAERGINANQRLTLTAGTGDLDEKGYNAYVSGFYYRSEGVNNRDLPYPFNSSNQTGIGGPDNRVLPSNFGTTTAGPNFYVAPANAAVSAIAPGARYQLLGNGCANGAAATTGAADLAADPTRPGTVCVTDAINRYGVVSPDIERFGGSGRFTAKVGDTSEAYLEVNFQQTRSSYSGDPSTIFNNAPAGILFPQFSTRSNATRFASGSGPLSLPVYVCAARLNCGTATDRRLNPNNPFAASGQNALLIGGLPDTVTQDETRSRVYRAAAGINGTIFGDWDYRVDLTAMHNDLRRTQNGYVYIQRLLDVIGDGSYNFVNPSANTAAVRNYLTPENRTDASSDLYQAQVTISKALFDLPGGPLQLGVGGTVFYEGVDAPSANSDENGPTQRYFTINAFGTTGHRTVSAAFAELNAPVFDQLTINGSARYDHYSTGQHYLSPKIGAKFTPLRQVALRGTFSKGFRIPSFAEANALPTTGYVTNNSNNFNDAFLAQYGCTVANFNTACPTYIRNGSYGQTTLATPTLKPEKSRSFTGGVILEPIRGVSFTVDYFNIRKTGAITSLTPGTALSAYYSGATIPAGYEVIADAPDAAFPNATPRVAFVRSNLVNANTLKSEGIDFGANTRFSFGNVVWTSNLDATLQLELSTSFPDGRKETYVDTLGNFNLTAGSGTFRWRGNWQNTFAIGDSLALTGTVNYTSGYDLSAMDQDTGYRDCGLAPDPAYTGCRVKSYVTFDANVSFKVNDKLTFYVNGFNLFDRFPPLDPVTYGAYLYNPVQAGENIYGRSFRAGAKFSF